MTLTVYCSVTMAESKVVSLRVPDELLQWVENLSDEEYPSSRSGRSGANRSQVILDALEFYRKHRNTVTDSSSTMYDSVTREELQEALAPLQHLQQRLETVEAGLAK